jgi:transcription elongation factor GreA
MEGEVPVTPEEYKAVEKEIEELKAESKRLSTEIARARDLGDLSENAEYHAAREQKGMVDGKVGSLQARLSTFRIVELAEGAADEIRFGCTVRLYDVNFDEELECKIVGGGQGAKPNEISVSSPVGKALLGHKVGDTVETAAPRGTIRYKVLKIS